jgi:hypothetical protein
MGLPNVPAVAKTALSLTRIPLLLLVCGLSDYALFRSIAPAVDPADFSNIIGLAAALETAAIEAALRIIKRRKEANLNEKSE